MNQNNHKRQQVIQKQLKMIERQEQRLFIHKEPGLVKSKIDPVVGRLQAVIPEKLKTTLEAAFLKGFGLIFEKGLPFIEKTYDKEKLNQEYDIHNYAARQYPSRKHMKRLDKPADRSKLLNSTIAVMEGGVLGLLGIGLPDIPIFLAVMIKTINEIAISYGYSYEGEEEKAYILNIISGALSINDDRKIYLDMADELGRKIDTGIVMDTNLQTRMEETSNILVDEMLTAKFIQGIPIVGVIGGIVNHAIIKKVSGCAKLKYKKRYLLKQMN